MYHPLLTKVQQPLDERMVITEYRAGIASEINQHFFKDGFGFRIRLPSGPTNVSHCRRR